MITTHKYLILFLLLMSAQMAFAQDFTDTDADTDDEGYEDPSQPEIDSLLSLITPQTPDSTKARYYKEIAEITGSTDTTIKYALLSLDFCNETDSILIAMNNRYIAWGYWMKDESRKGIPFLLKSIEICRQMDRQLLVSRHYELLSKMYSDLNKFDSVSFYMNKAIEYEIKGYLVTCRVL